MLKVSRAEYDRAVKALQFLYIAVPEEVAKDVSIAMSPLLQLAYDQLPAEDNPTNLPHISGPDQ